jgi:hypothetical protein
MTQHFVITDPRDFDGDPFEVAERACRQAEAVAAILERCLNGANLMARNAEMERNLLESDDAKAAGWEDSLQGRHFATLIADAQLAQRRLQMLAKATAFNPRKA